MTEARSYVVTIVDDLATVEFERRCFAGTVEEAVSDSIKAARAVGHFHTDTLNREPMLSITVRPGP